MTKHDDWMSKHFAVTDPPKIIRPDPEETDRGRRFWLFLSLLLILPPACVGVAYYLGYLDPIIREVFVDRTVVADPPPAPPNKKQPNVNITYEAKQRHEPEVIPEKPTPAPDKTVTRARANELQRLITSRNSGIDLMVRDRAAAIDRQSRASADLATAKQRLIDLDKKRPSGNDSARIYQWNLARDDSIAAAKNATQIINAQQKTIDSFNGRIDKAELERDNAKAELHGAVIIDN